MRAARGIGSGDRGDTDAADDTGTGVEAHVADLDEIEANDFNLNISRHVDTTEPIEVMSVEDALTQLRHAERRRDEAVTRMDELLAELGYAR